MKRLLTACILLLLLANAMTFCSKNNTSANLLLLQHKWNIVSLIGEVYYYKGAPQDYYDFRADSKLYTYMSGRFDTSAYTLANGGNTLMLYHIANGIQTPTNFPLNIKTLSSSSLVLENHATPVAYILDSLSR